MGDSARKLRVAAVQMESVNSDIEANLKKATGMAEEAAERGARLIVLPEFMATGYVYTKEIWAAGEPKQGPTVQWLKESAGHLQAWMGASFLEAEGEDFFNTFVLVGPDGKEEGRVRKQTPAFAEAYFTKGDSGPHVIESDLGRIGVGICYENSLAYIPRLMCSQSVDLMLMPHSAPSPMPNFMFPAKAVARYNDNLRGLAEQYSKLLGVPAIMINKTGPWESKIPFMPWLKQHSSFPGFSAIADSDGRLKAQLGDEEAVIVEDILMDPERKRTAEPETFGRWATKVPLVENQFRIIEGVGKLWYAASLDRRRRAREISR
jgi:N-carbamoylputrescine amidase